MKLGFDAPTQDFPDPRERPRNYPVQRPGTFYHVAPATARQSIMQNGLIGHLGDHQVESPWGDANWEGREEQPHGNYLWQSPALAMQYIQALHSRGKVEKPQYEEDWWDHGIEPFEQSALVRPQERPEDWNADYDDEDAADEAWYEHQHQHSEPWNSEKHFDLLPERYRGHDIWKVNIDPDKHTVRMDPEDALTEGGELSTAEALHDFGQKVDEDGDYEGDKGNYRWYTPQGIEPEHLRHYRHVPIWEMPEYSESEEWQQDAYDQEVPDAFTRVPMIRHWGSAADDWRINGGSMRDQPVRVVRGGEHIGEVGTVTVGPTELGMIGLRLPSLSYPINIHMTCVEPVDPREAIITEHPDPWMDNEPGTLTLPEHWSAADDWDIDESDLHGYLERSTEIYPWVRGKLGKWFITPEGNFRHWQTNTYGEPHHDAVASEWGLQQALKGEIAPNGAWWVTEVIDPSVVDPDEWCKRAEPQALKAGLQPWRPSRMGSANCPKCGMNHPSEEECPTDWGDGADWAEDPLADPFADLRPQSHFDMTIPSHRWPV